MENFRLSEKEYTYHCWAAANKEAAAKMTFWRFLTKCLGYSRKQLWREGITKRWLEEVYGKDF